MYYSLVCLLVYFVVCLLLLYRSEGIHTAVSSDVESIFKGKTLKQLSLLEDQVKKKLKGTVR